MVNDMMKRIFTLCVGLMATLFAGAQGFVFQYQGESLADGETVIIAAEEDIFGDLSCETNSAMNPTDGLMLKLLNSTSAGAAATLQITSNSLNADMLQWCMGGDCTTLGSQTSLTKRFTVNGSAQVQFDAIAISSEGILTATLKVTIGLESHQVNIIFVNGDYDGIKEVEKFKSSIVEKGAIFDLLGRQVKRTSSGICIVKDGERIRKVLIK
jgi:hypothetical protein